MGNPLIGTMGGGSVGFRPAQNMDALKQAAQSAKRMMGMLQGVKDPKQALMAAAQQNPQLAAVMQMCNGRNPQEVFLEECGKRGVDPDMFIRALRD